MKQHIVIVGAGIAGASLAWDLGDRADVTLLESEDQPGFHTTGRSVALYSEIYGGRTIQPFTTASRAFFDTPPAGFMDGPILRQRGVLHVANQDETACLDELQTAFADSGVVIERIRGDAVRTLCPQLAQGWDQDALWEPLCCDIDVAGLHGAYLAGGRRAGVRQLNHVSFLGAKREKGAWKIETSQGDLTADILVNAAGAWGDEIATRSGVAPMGLAPLRRTVIVADVAPAPAADQVFLMAADGSFYCKPDAGYLWASPHDETPDTPRDVVPEELDIAIAVDRMEKATSFRVKRIVRSWAGLRTFATDRAPIIGFAPDEPGFFWCVGQGGFGIQTAPALARLGSALILGGAIEAGIDAASVSPDRFAPKG